MLTIEQCLAARENGVMIPNEHYHRLDGISGSQLPLLEESNKHYDNRHKFSPGDASHFDLGTHVHSLALEGVNNAAVMPKFESKAVCGVLIKEQKQEFLGDNNGKLIIAQDDYDKSLRMAENVRAIAGDIIHGGIIELSIFAQYSTEPVIIKCRIDCQHGDDDYDLKTITPKSSNLSELELKRHCEHYGYYKSAALRNIVRRTLGINIGDSYLIFVSTSPGHMVKIRRLRPEIIAEHEDYIHDLLLQRRRYLKNLRDLDIKDLLC